MDNALIRKLRLEKRTHRLLVNRPAGVAAIDGGQFGSDRTLAPFSAILVFVFTLSEMAAAVAEYGPLLEDDGQLLLCYPKTGNKAYAAIGRDDIFPAFGLDEDGDGFVPGTPLRFNLMAGLDATFTVVGLKRIDDRSSIRIPGVSQRAADYEHRVDELAALIGNEDRALAAAFTAQTPGRKRDQARRIFSAVKAETRAKRLAALCAELSR